ncbi:carbon storage regulator [Adhaeretor mobilis]|uniref:Translational regulator CsrA n=1 Tax=Adhaeretor mobilis TaxID=1930276 RepID=A0A517MY91_9BACT|nr:carbon storage regulator [Adhaeretor mobilis]QDS99826.1 hypothetical protein HG15A2_31570 [Adhaeretor mobilis]
MLVLTRKQNEQICIGNDIKITVIRTKGKAVRLGIEAPTEISVLRGELVFDDTSPEAAPEKPLAKGRQPAPVADGSPFISEKTSQESATAHWPGSQPRSESSSLCSSKVSAISMSDYLTARAGV